VVDATFDGNSSAAIPQSGCGGQLGSNSTYVSLCGRVTAWAGFKGGPVSGYCLRVAMAGDWTLTAGWPVILAAGELPSSSSSRRLGLTFSGPSVAASIDGRVVAEVASTSFSRGLAALASGWHAASFDNFHVVAARPKPLVEHSLLAGVQQLSFDYNLRTCTPPPESTTKLRNDFAGKVGLEFKVTSQQDVRVTSLLRYMIDGNAKQHVLELFGHRGQDYVSIANASLDMWDSVAKPLDALGFAAAPLSTPVLLKSGHQYLLVSSEVEGGDRWMDVVPVNVAASSPFEISRSVYQSAGPDLSWHSGRTGSFAYGPLSLYFAVADSNLPTKRFV